MDELDAKLATAGGREEAVLFLAAGSRGMQHNRQRALLARRLKHVALKQDQKGLLVTSILAKLASGDIDERFMDQLRLCLSLDVAMTLRSARALLLSEKEYVRRYARRILMSGGYSSPT